MIEQKIGKEHNIQESEECVRKKGRWAKFQKVTQDDVRKIIKDLKPYAAAGADQIPAKIIKDNTDTVAEPIAHLVNLSLQSGIFPNIYKEAIIRPIHKGGEKDDINTSNYRPISLISNVSKILEKLVKNQLTKYLEDSHYFAKYQMGFRKNRGTDDAIIKVHTEITKSLDNKKKMSRSIPRPIKSV